MQPTTTTPSASTWPRAHDARHQIGRAAGRIAEDQAQRPRGVVLRAGGMRDARERGSTRGQLQKFAAGELHAELDNGVGGVPALLHAVAREILNDIRLDGLGLRDVGIAIGSVALLQLGKPASVERTCQLRVQSQRRTIIVDG
jgi:hypothetical protein